MLKSMGALALVCLLLSAPSWAAQSQVAQVKAEDWKGKDDPSEFSVGAMAGMGILDNHVGFSLLPTISKKIIQRGFVPDISNDVSIEAQTGALFISGGTAFVYSAHLRWNFNKDEFWSLYAIGGLGGAITGVALGDRFELYPRFGLGAIWKIAENFRLRGEVSHEFVGLGILFPL